MPRTIISVHTPKVAGTSFLHQLKALYGEDQLLLDYKDDPTNPLSIINIDPNHYDASPIESIDPYLVVHGHFHPAKYSHVNNAFRMTFLRHPIDNVKSIYDFWSARDRGFWDHPIFNYFKDANLSLPRLAMISKIRNLYSHTYFGDYDMSQFDFIGDYAIYDLELVRLGKCLGVDFDLSVRHNITADCYKNMEDSDKGGRSISDTEYVELADILKNDIEFYETYKGR